MSVVRRWLLIPCLMLAMSLPAQTSGTAKKKPAKPAPTEVSTTPEPVPQTPQANEPVATPPVTADTDSDLNNPRSLKLSLSDAIRTAMSQNLGVQIQRFGYQESAQSLRGAWGIYDWLGTATLLQSSSTSPTISQFLSTGSRNTVADFGISQFIPTGGSYSVAFSNSRETSTGGGITLNPLYRSGLKFDFDQPLLRNFGTDVSSRGITIARNNLGINRELFRGVLMDTAVGVEQAYLDLVYARQFVDVVKEALFLARDQARITQIRIDVGASAPLDILQPRVQIATQEENLIAAVATVRDAEDRLRAFMHLDPVDWDRPIIPVDPVTYTPMNVSAEQAVTMAFDLRPELREQALTTANRRVQYVFARNQVLPKVDLTMEYNPTGVAGTVINPATGESTGISTGYPRALRQVLNNDFPSWTVGFNVGVPILNIGARAEAKRSELDWRLAQTSEAQERQQIVLEVRKTVRDIETNAKEITASRAARDAAEKNVDAERKRYENGMTTNFNVLQIQQQLEDARVREIQALVGYNKAVSAYHRAVGDLLEVRNIRVDEEPVQQPQLFTAFDRYNWLRYETHAKVEEPKK